MVNYAIKTIDVQELKHRRDINPSLLLIDVRELDEWQFVHIPGAIHLPKDQLPSQIKTHISNHEQPVYLYCKGGVRSYYAAGQLVEMGYQQVYSVNGGIIDWAAQGFPLVESSQEK